MIHRGGFQSISAMAVCCLLALAGAGPVCADPDEAWVSRATVPADVRPLLIVVLDTSIAMIGRIKTLERFDPLFDYATTSVAAVRCDPQLVYWRRGPGPAPDCGTMTGFALEPTSADTGMHCDAARSALERHGMFVAARATQWRSMTTTGHWDALRTSSADAVECRSDRGLHGAVDGNWYATDGSQGPWSGAPMDEIDWNAAPHGDSYVFYTGNYLNYLASTDRVVEVSLAQAAASMLAETIDSTDELDVALLRLSHSEAGAEDGLIALAPTPAIIAAQQVGELLSDWPASGPAPLAGTLIETARWLSGIDMPQGQESPFTSPCRPVTIAIATAGDPSDDDDAAVAAQELPGFDALTDGCDASCLPALAQWLVRTDLRVDLPGSQAAVVTWLAPSPPAGVIADALAQAGGKIAFADDPLAFANVIARSLQRDAAIPAGPQLSTPGLLADASSPLPAAIYGLSAPQASERWLGNALRYSLAAPAGPFEAPIAIGRDGEPALDLQTGLPRPESTSAWSVGPDGDRLLDGSAAARLPVAEARRIYSDLTPDELTAPRNHLHVNNPAAIAAIPGFGAHEPWTATDAIAWLRNQRRLGDPGVRVPVTASYPSDQSRSAFLVTHDGLLHAFDAETGIERWAFMPGTMLARLPDLMRDEATTVRRHGIDGPVVLHRHDPNGDGRIDAPAGEHLWLLYGLGRGGAGYHALDVAAPELPRLLWTLGPPDLNRGAMSWPEPVVARLSIEGSGQSAGDWVVFQAGGYDPNYDFVEPGSSGTGASLSIRDAETGRLLWQTAGDAAQEPDLHLPEMSSSLASAPRVIDLDGDGYVDRLYVVDIAGGLWRFELQNRAPSAGLARAHLLARLGGTGQRFYSSPDVSLIREADGPRLAVSLGSGWLARPREGSITDRFYSIHDRQPATSTVVLTESALYDATDADAPMPPAAPGWFVRLEDHGAGEKVIGPSATFDHRLYFITYQPQALLDAAPCGPPQAIRRLRTLDVRTGMALPWTRVPGDPAEHELSGSGLPPPLRFAFPGPWDGACADCRAKPFGIVGTEMFDAGFANDPVKTSWRRLLEEPDSR
jgi:type IV pilus assembly protein PilY1